MKRRNYTCDYMRKKRALEMAARREAKKEQEEQTQIKSDEETSLRVNEEDQVMNESANSKEQHLFEEGTKATEIFYC